MQASEELGKKVSDNENLNSNPEASSKDSHQDPAPHEGEAHAGEKAELGSLREELEAAKKESLENYNKFVRAMADMENIKRRTEKEKSDIHQFALESLLKDMLPVLDSLNKAAENTENRDESSGNAAAPEGKESFVEGMLMVGRQLNETLEKHGLVGIDAKNTPFDPNLHQAISRLESADTEKEMVKDEYSKGYTLNGRLLRPAMVSVIVPIEGN